ncbi:MAG: methionyl-tRNA formyltransferase [Candidatus Gastranaerophilales bacterium]|nr:methionyl-tRNA formyltransferase [Candidatus Gastranaerophilales bacterium]
MNKIKVVFFATPDIAISSFEFFINSPDYTMEALVTIKPKAQNRGNKIVQRNITAIARKNNIPVFEPDKISKEPDIIEQLKKINPDFFVTFAFGQILSQEVIDIPRIATINLHASLLPEYRGANPIAQAIIDGKTKTGITTMKTVLALDAGDICLQDEIEISQEMNVVELMDEISNRSPKLLDKTLKGLYEGSLNSICQDETCATFTKKLNKQDKIINWNTKSSELHNKIRGMYQINTNHTTFNNKIIKVLKTRPSNCTGNACEVLDITKEGIIIGCKEGSLELLKVKPEGKGEMKASDWARGARIKKGDILGR